MRSMGSKGAIFWCLSMCSGHATKNERLLAASAAFFTAASQRRPHNPINITCTADHPSAASATATMCIVQRHTHQVHHYLSSYLNTTLSAGRSSSLPSSVFGGQCVQTCCTRQENKRVPYTIFSFQLEIGIYSHPAESVLLVM